MDDLRIKIKPLYEELKGMRDAIPTGTSVYDNGISTKYHQTLAAVSELIGDLQTDDYKLSLDHAIYPGMKEGSRVLLDQYRINLNAIIGNLKGRFDFDSNQNHTGHTFIQNQSVSIELVLNLQEKIINLEKKYDEGTPEKTFLQKLKGSLSSIKDATDIIKIVLVEAQKAGITLDKLASMFAS
jgi:hypothetical protein